MPAARTTVSLNGTWDLAFDPDNTGKKKGWAKALPKKTERLAVPGVWELIRPDYDGVAWYSRVIDADPAWQGGVVRLKFGAVHYFSEVYLNGKAVGAHEGGGSQFEFDITRLLKPGANRLTVRVIGPASDRMIEGFRAGAPLNQSNIPVGKAAWYFNYGGIWQDVELEITAPVRVSDIFVKPRLADSTALALVTVANHGAAARRELRVAISEAASGRVVAEETRTVELPPGESELSFPLRIDGFTAWDCENPFLYRASATLGDDAASVRFGMRELTISGDKLTLNGTPIILKGFLQQGIYPRTIIFPETREMGLKELQLLKEHGFNFVRSHLKAANPWWFDLCDELGILVEAEPGIGWIINSPETERRCATEINAMLRRDRNHPSIFMWCLLNEAYHFQGFSMEEVKAMTARLAETGRRLDDTRLLMDTSGGGGGDETDGGALVWLPNVAKQAVITDDHAYCPLPLADRSISDYRTRGRDGMAWLISEFGAPVVPPDYKKVLASYRPAERKLGLEDYKLHRDFYASLSSGFAAAKLKGLFGSVDGFIARINAARADEMRLVTAAQRCNPRLVGTAFCQLADASGEEFGATDFFRNPKPVFHAMARAMRTPLVAPEIAPRVQLPGEQSQVRLTLVNETKLGVTYDYALEIVAGKARTLLKQGTVRADAAVQTVLVEDIAPVLKPGAYALRATLRAGGQTWSEEVAFTVLATTQLNVPAVTLHDPQNVMRDFFAARGVATKVFDNNYRDKSKPVILDLRGGQCCNRIWLTEHFPQLKKIVQAGGAAVLINPEPLMLQEAFFDHRLRPTGYMRTLGYVAKHPVFAGLPSGCVTDYRWAGLSSKVHERGDDVRAAGGEVLSGGFAGHMWTRPADYTWSANVYTIPLGRGTAYCCQLRVLDNLAGCALSRNLLTNLVNVAAKGIKPGYEHLLYSRCIDPLKPSDWR